MMDTDKDEQQIYDDLDEDDKARIMTLFFEEIVPKLKHLDARKGNINCHFAGEQYQKWTIRFQSRGADFEIMEFEYDEKADNMDLDL